MTDQKLAAWPTHWEKRRGNRVESSFVVDASVNCRVCGSVPGRRQTPVQTLRRRGLSPILEPCADFHAVSPAVAWATRVQTWLPGGNHLCPPQTCLSFRRSAARSAATAWPAVRWTACGCIREPRSWWCRTPVSGVRCVPQSARQAQLRCLFRTGKNRSRRWAARAAPLVEPTRELNPTSADP